MAHLADVLKKPEESPSWRIVQSKHIPRSKTWTALHCTALRRSRTWVWFTTIKSLAPPPLPLLPFPSPRKRSYCNWHLPALAAGAPALSWSASVCVLGGWASEPLVTQRTISKPNSLPQLQTLPTFFPTTCTSAPHPRTALSFCFCYSITIPLTYRLTTPARIDRGLCCLFDCAQPTFTAIRLRNPAAFASHIPPQCLSRSPPIPCATIE